MFYLKIYFDQVHDNFCVVLEKLTKPFNEEKTNNGEEKIARGDCSREPATSEHCAISQFS
jgi:hypothetical protein